MNMDLSIYEMSLRQTERDLGALDDERERIKREIRDKQAELRDLGTKRIEWIQLSGHIKKLLRLELTEEETKLCIEPTVASEPQVAITRSTFKGMSIADAARRYLMMVGRGVRQRELIDTLISGGVKTDAKHLDAAFRNALARRPDWFVFIREKKQLGRWELTEWQNGDFESLQGEVTPAQQSPPAPEPAVPVQKAA